MTTLLFDGTTGTDQREDRRLVCDHYALELLGLELELAAGDERERPLVLAVLVSERIAQLTVDRCWS